MTDRPEDPQALLQQGLQRHRKLTKAADESRERAKETRRIRVANGFDRLIADILGGRA